MHFAVHVGMAVEDVARWLVDRFSLTAEDARAGGNYAFWGACENGHLDVVQWLAEHFNFTTLV